MNGYLSPSPSPKRRGELLPIARWMGPLGEAVKAA